MASRWRQRTQNHFRLRSFTKVVYSIRSCDTWIWGCILYDTGSQIWLYIGITWGVLKIHIPRLVVWSIVLSLGYLKSAQVIVITAKLETHYFRAGYSNGSQAGMLRITWRTCEKQRLRLFVAVIFLRTSADWNDNVLNLS